MLIINIPAIMQIVRKTILSKHIDKNPYLKKSHTEDSRGKIVSVGMCVNLSRLNIDVAEKLLNDNKIGL